MNKACVVLLILLMCCASAVARQTTGEWLGAAGFGVAGGLAGTVVSVIVISEGVPAIESRIGRTALVICSLTVIDGLGAAGGVLAAARLWGSDGSPGSCLLGGMLGGLASAFVEPLLSVIGLPEGWTEFLGMVSLPILPALGALVGFRL